MSKHPFILNGHEVLCMSCAHTESYQIVFDELHNKDIFWAVCGKSGKQVGLPLNKCDNFQEAAE